MKPETKRLLKNSIVVLIIGTGVYFGVDYLGRNSEAKLQIEDTEIQIESIKTIAEISTVSYHDEVVLDTVELYDNNYDILNITDWPGIYDRINYKNVKRRLTLIIKGVVRYGVDLSDENFKIDNQSDSIFITVPKPEILNVIITPSKTEVFQEKGKWNDAARKELEERAKYILRTNSEELGLYEKSIDNTTKLFEKLLNSPKVIVVNFE